MRADEDEWVVQFVVAMQQFNPARSCDDRANKALAHVVYRSASRVEPVMVAQVFAVAADWFECPETRWSDSAISAGMPASSYRTPE